MMRLRSVKPVVGRRIPVARYPLDAAQAGNSQKQVQVLDLRGPVQVVEAVLDRLAAGHQVGHNITLEHGRGDHIR